MKSRISLEPMGLYSPIARIFSENRLKCFWFSETEQKLFHEISPNSSFHYENLAKRRFCKNQPRQNLCRFSIYIVKLAKRRFCKLYGFQDLQAGVHLKLWFIENVRSWKSNTALIFAHENVKIANFTLIKVLNKTQKTGIPKSLVRAVFLCFLFLGGYFASKINISANTKPWNTRYCAW